MLLIVVREWDASDSVSQSLCRFATGPCRLIYSKVSLVRVLTEEVYLLIQVQVPEETALHNSNSPLDLFFTSASLNDSVHALMHS